MMCSTPTKDNTFENRYSTPPFTSGVNKSQQLSPPILRHTFSIGDLVEVEARTWPGINKAGGIGKVSNVNRNGTYRITYVLGGNEKQVEAKYIKGQANVFSAVNRPVKARDFFSDYQQKKANSVTDSSSTCSGDTERYTLVSSVDKKLSEESHHKRKHFPDVPAQVKKAKPEKKFVPPPVLSRKLSEVSIDDKPEPIKKQKKKLIRPRLKKRDSEEKKLLIEVEDPLPEETIFVEEIIKEVAPSPIKKVLLIEPCSVSVLPIDSNPEAPAIGPLEIVTLTIETPVCTPKRRSVREPPKESVCEAHFGNVCTTLFRVPESPGAQLAASLSKSGNLSSAVVAQLEIQREERRLVKKQFMLEHMKSQSALANGLYQEHARDKNSFTRLQSACFLANKHWRPIRGTRTSNFKSTNNNFACLLSSMLDRQKMEAEVLFCNQKSELARMHHLSSRVAEQLVPRVSVTYPYLAN